jgi:hypothetical protein
VWGIRAVFRGGLPVPSGNLHRYEDLSPTVYISTCRHFHFFDFERIRAIVQGEFSEGTKREAA